jgi:serine/threonine protein kinase
MERGLRGRPEGEVESKDSADANTSQHARLDPGTHMTSDAPNASSQVFARTKPAESRAAGDGSDAHAARDRNNDHAEIEIELDPADAMFDDDSDAEQAIESNVVDLDPLIGTLIAGKYRVLRLLGRGSTGAVYLCQHLGLDKPVALKILHREMEQNAGFVEGFKLEAQAASRLEHPNSVRVLDFGEDVNGALFIVMEYVEGRDLLRCLEEDGPFSAERAIDVMSQILDALAVAHSLGIVHRDLKPENVVVRTLVIDGIEKELVTVCDFGIAQFSATRLGASTSTVEVGMVVGTPAYMPPEQARAEEQDARSDIYSAGVVLFQLLTLHLPFEADDAMAVAYKHCSEPPPRPSQFGAVSPALEEICLKALSKAREARYQTAREMRNALQRALNATPLPRPRPGLRWGNAGNGGLGRSLPSGQNTPLPMPLRPDGARADWKAPGSLRPQEIFVSPKATDSRRLSRRVILGLVALIAVGSTAGLLQHAHVFDSASSSGSQSAAAAETSRVESSRAETTREAKQDELHGAHVVRPSPLQPESKPAPESSATPENNPAPRDGNAPSAEPALPAVAISDGPTPPNAPATVDANEHSRPSDPYAMRPGPTVRSPTLRSSTPNAPTVKAANQRAHAPSATNAPNIADSQRPVKSAKPVKTASASANAPQSPKDASASKPRSDELDAFVSGLIDSPPPSAAAKTVEPQPIAASASGRTPGDVEREPAPNGSVSQAHAATDKPVAPANPILAAVPERARVEIQGINVRAASKAGVRSALNMGAISGCYRSALRSGGAPAIALTADMELVTSTTGGVTSATLRAPELGSEVRRCIEQVARRGRVRDTDTGEAQANITLAFAPR